MAAIAALLGTYAAAGALAALIPVNDGWRPPAQGVAIWVESNGVHTGLVVPRAAAGVDWGPLVRGGGTRYLAFGWGEAAFYRDTPRWQDVRPGTVLRAAFGSDDTLLHVEQRRAPVTGAKRVVLRPAEYRRLAAFIRASFAPNAVATPGYGRHDHFYAARGRYDALRTCNGWTGRALIMAGVRMGWWTPFPDGVMRWL